MFLRVLPLLSIALVACLGCTGGSSTAGAGTTDPEVAQMVGRQVNEFIVKAEKIPAARAKGELDILLESLEGAAGRSAAFAKVRDEAKTLQEMYATNAPKPQITEQIAALKTAAGTLTE